MCLFLARSGDAIWATGLTFGSTAQTPSHGSGDVFAVKLDLTTGLPEVG